MLPSHLLITRRWRDKIRPVYAPPQRRNLTVAQALIHTYEDHVGKKKGKLNEALGSLEELDHDYRFVRGLSTLLDRRCQLESRTIVDSVEARRSVFRIAHRDGFPTTPAMRQKVLDQAASALGIAVEELEKSLYGDLEDELVLREFDATDPEVLLRQYNLSLTQTLLFYSTELTFTTLGNWQRIFRQIKWLGLIYTITRGNGGYEVKVDGPASLFKLTRRYGTSLAKIVPLILQNRTWHLRANILRRTREGRLLDLELDSDKHGGLMTPLDEPKETASYDSQVELDFARRFQALDTGWTLVREPQPMPVGRQVMIPDFAFQKSGVTVYLEVAGFWTPQYLEKKIKKLELVDGVDLIVAADSNLACRKLDKVGRRLNLIYYKTRIPLRPILNHLRTLEERMVVEQTRLLRTEPLLLQRPVVELSELAEELGVLLESLRRIVNEREIPAYTQLGDILIKDIKLKEIQQSLENALDQDDLSVDEATRMIENAGVKQPTSILDALGYKIEWHGIDPQSAKIRRAA
jgi:predicted nuclease of restriction endonuclease-like RecB superfamily